MQKIIPATLFPLTLISSLALVYWLHQSIGLTADIATVLVTIGAALWIWAWEYIMPYRLQWNKNDDDLVTDAIHLAITGILTKLIKPMFLFLLFPLLAYLGSQFGSDDLWPQHWPIIAQLILMLVICEFGRYWFHRWSHNNSMLWRFHAVHHSPNRLYWLNAARFHPLERFYLQVPELLPFILLNPTEEVLMLYLVTNSVHGFFQHANIQTRIGMFNYVFSMAELHRWHHSKIIGQSDRNFGNILIFWDLIFGTFYLPKHKSVGSIGVLNPAYPHSYLGQLTAPFKYRLDKPADYEQRKDYYHQQISENKQNTDIIR
jgi:sterol desaturase/sphingolipid hydroxylase (fatty acid hydroxylase superfamily)